MGPWWVACSNTQPYCTVVSLVRNGPVGSIRSKLIRRPKKPQPTADPDSQERYAAQRACFSNTHSNTTSPPDVRREPAAGAGLRITSRSPADQRAGVRRERHPDGAAAGRLPCMDAL
jgi:hypothetical protein